MNKRFRFSLAELLILTTAIAVLAAEARVVGLSVIQFALLATLAVLTAHRLSGRSSLLWLIGVPVLVFLIVLLLLPQVQ